MRVGILKDSLKMASYNALFRAIGGLQHGDSLKPWQIALINNMANPSDNNEVRLKSPEEISQMHENREKFRKALRAEFDAAALNSACRLPSDDPDRILFKFEGRKKLREDLSNEQ